MPIGNPIQKNNDTRIVSSTATTGQTDFTITGGYTINAISVFRNGVRLSNSDDFTASDGSTVSLNVAADVGDSLDFHVFDKFTVANAIVGAASSQTVSGNLRVTGELYSDTFKPDNILTTGITTTGTLNVTGTSTLTGNVSIGSSLLFADNKKAQFGNDGDFSIFHDATYNKIESAATRQLLIRGDGGTIIADAAGNKMIETVNGAGTDLYHDGTKKFETTTSGVSVSGNVSIPDSSHLYLGASNDLDLYHTAGADSFLVTSSGQMYQRYANNLYIQTASTENAIVANANGAVELYHNNVKTLETHAQGAKISGPSSSPGTLYIYGAEGQDAELKLVTDDGDDNPDYYLFLNQNSDNSLRIQNYGDGSYEDNIVAKHGGAVELYHDNGIRLATTADGADFSGTGSVKLPVGTTAQRSGSPTAGDMRYNSTLSQFEGYTSAWGALGGGATGGGSDTVFFENGQTVTTDYTITNNMNAGSFGPITINSGVTVTVGSGEVWTVV